MTMRVVLDTNVLLSGLLWHGPPHTLIEHVREGTLFLVSSPALLAELTEVIARPQFTAILARSNTSPEHSLAELRALAEVIEPAPLATPVCRDPDDDAVLALAIAARADLIVSGDKDLLDLQHVQDIPIVTPTQALRRTEAQI
ncbi:MAG TPA: putative toxin-antitoxin system toxin component, PIN family [Steroidobacteraceae bacterium]